MRLHRTAGWDARTLAAPGRWLLGTSLVFVSAGFLAGLPVVTALGAVGLLGVLSAIGWARWIGDQIGRGALVATVAGLGDAGRLAMGRPADLPLTLSSPIGLDTRRAQLTPVFAGAVSAQLTSDASDGTWRLVLTTVRVGHGWMHGFRVALPVAGGLVTARGRLPCRAPWTVLPRRFPLRREPGLEATRATTDGHTGSGRLRRRGLGMDIRELRDHLPGDPFKHIAWSASARRGKLISREFESELLLSVWIVLDASPSMFWGTPGNTRIDFALETAFNLATLLLGRGDRAGVLVHDEVVRMVVPPAAGRGQLLRIVDTLLEVPHLVHAERTEITRAELIEAVAGWFTLAEHESVRLVGQGPGRLGPRSARYDEDRLIAAAQTFLGEVRARRRPPRFTVPEQAYAADPHESILRAFCRHAGIVLPLETTTRPGAQARGIESAVETVLRTPGGPHALVLISDLYTADDLDALRRAALGARRHHHAVTVLCPIDPAFETAGAADASAAEGDPLREGLIEIERLRLAQNLAAVETVLRPAGVTLVACGPEDIAPCLLAKLDRVA